MKHSDSQHTHNNKWQAALPAIVWIWTFAIAIIPNIGLEITDTLLPDGSAGIMLRWGLVILPAGAYILIMSMTRRVGTTFWIMFPLIFLSAFQMVLLDLFGSQPIAVDMWLNLATTNTTEATELLGSLFISIVVLTVLYVPAIVMAIYATVKKLILPDTLMRMSRRAAIFLLSLGIFMTMGALSSAPQVSLLKSLYPVNVVYNLKLAVNRTYKIAHYHDTSAGYTFHAHSTRPDSIAEVYVVVIGETARSDHFSLYGYHRQTNPRLTKSNNRLVRFNNNLSESNTTHKSVPMLMSHLDATTFEDSVYTTKGMLTALHEAGFATAYLSNQGRNGSFIDFFGEEADTTVFIRDSRPAIECYDTDLLPLLESQLQLHPTDKLVVVLHTYGSHFKYNDRYPDGFDTPFTVEGFLEASPVNRHNLVNAYDNTIVYTDSLLGDIIDTLTKTGRPSAMIYTSDHGEDLYDDEMQRFLHASPLPTYPQVRVPLLLWCSESYDTIAPDALATARTMSELPVSSTKSLFHTLLDLAGVQTPILNTAQSLIRPEYTPPIEPLYLNDHNEAVKLSDIVLLPPSSHPKR